VDREALGLQIVDRSDSIRRLKQHQRIEYPGTATVTSAGSDREYR